MGDKAKIFEWTNKWLMKAGVTQIRAEVIEYSAETKRCRVAIHQQMPVVQSIQDKVHQEQVINVEFYSSEGPDSVLLSSCHPIRVLAQDTTEVELEIPFQPQCALLNSDNLGYARVMLDESQVNFFLGNISKIEKQLNRSLAWFILRDHVNLLKISPISFLECFIDNIARETEQNTIVYLLN
mmetsp:Transcript_16916/g.28639  ORF Transcript_16916/g.28639 Transcript_16916/m.28639 type:complete len:182 (+) Transcript_16916:1431-1976(+)